jgi:hypothetical protein
MSSVLALCPVDGAVAGQAIEERRTYVPAGSRIPRWEENRLADYRDSVRILREFARCIIRRDPEGAARLMETTPESDEQRDAVAALIGPHDSCLYARSMRVSVVLFRGAAAERFLRLQDPPVTVLPSPAQLEDYAAFSSRLAAVDSDGLDDDDRANIVGRWLARCIAHERPDVIRAVLATRSMSEEEQEALNAAELVFSACLMEGQTLNVHQLTIRGLLAEALYHRTKAEGPAPSPGG